MLRGSKKCIQKMYGVQHGRGLKSPRPNRRAGSPCPLWLRQCMMRILLIWISVLWWIHVWSNAVHAHLNKVMNNCCTSNFNERRNIDLFIFICFPIYFNLLKEAAIDATFGEVKFIHSTMIIMKSDVDCPNEWLKIKLHAIKRHKILS